MFNKIFKKRFKILARDDSINFVAYPGDTFEIIHSRDYIGSKGKVIGTEDVVVLKEEIKEKMIINSAVIFEFEDIFEMKDGIGGAFGERRT